MFSTLYSARYSELYPLLTSLPITFYHLLSALFYSSALCFLTLYYMLRNNASGPEIGLPGWILTGLLSGKHRKQLSGRPSAGRRANFGAFPVAVLPKSGPEGRFLARKHYCVT